MRGASCSERGDRRVPGRGPTFADLNPNKCESTRCAISAGIADLAGFVPGSAKIEVGIIHLDQIKPFGWGDRTAGAAGSRGQCFCHVIDTPFASAHAGQ